MNAESTQTDEGESFAKISPKRRRLRGILMLVAPVVVLIGALYFYLTGGRYESTENASLQTGMVAVSPSVSGKVTAIEVRENQRVSKGDVLFRIASDSYEAAVAEAEAELADARADIGSRLEFRKLARTPSCLRALTWSCIRAISGEITTPQPGRTRAGTW